MRTVQTDPANALTDAPTNVAPNAFLSPNTPTQDVRTHEVARYGANPETRLIAVETDTRLSPAACAAGESYGGYRPKLWIE